MTPALFLIAVIHSITNLKTYEKAKIFFNPANTQSSSKESLKGNDMHLLICIPFIMVQYANTEFMS